MSTIEQATVTLPIRNLDGLLTQAYSTLPTFNYWTGGLMNCRSIGSGWMHLVTAAGVVMLTGGASIAQTTSPAENWPRFRGSTDGVIADNPGLPETWSRTENVIWNIEVPGQGWSSPIVWDDLIFVTSVLSDEVRQGPGQDVIPEPSQEGLGLPVTSIDGVASRPPLATPYTWMLYAIDFETGQIRWERELRRGLPINPKHPKNTYASETPVTDGKHIYVFHGNAGLFAVDFDGQLIWSREVTIPDGPSDAVTEARIAPGGPPIDYFVGIGQAASPALHENQIFVAADHETRTWFFAAFSTQTGEELWHVLQPKSEEAYGWSTPFVWAHDQRTEVVILGNNRVHSYDLDGQLLWSLKGLSVSTTPTPFSANGLLYVSSGYPSERFRPVYAIRPGASGDISLGPDETSNSHVVWFQRSAGTYMPSGLVYDDLFYGLYTQGFLTAHDAKTGEEVYGRVRIARGTGGFTSSPWAYNGKVFAMSEDGDTYVIAAGPEYKLLGQNSLGEMVNATPAIIRGNLLIRTVSSLWRIGKID